MSDDQFTPPPDDPFTSNDPAAHERERRRLQREAKRHERSGRASLASRVSGALDGAAAKGREKIEQGKERVVTPPEPPAEGAEPPPLRRTAAPPPTPKPAAPVPPLDAAASEPPQAARTPESPPATPRTSRAPADEGAPRTVIHDETDEFGAAAPIKVNPDAPPPPGTGEGPAVPAGVGATPPPRRKLSSGAIWRRRLLALALIVFVAVGGYVAVKKLGNEEPAPVAKGPKTLKTVSVSIPEGYTVEEMAEVAKDADLDGSYEDAAKEAAKKFDFKKVGAPSGTDTLEGFLFPATYELEKGAPAKDLVNDQLEAFDANLAEVDLSNAKKKNLTVYDVVTIASMIEREVQVPEERDVVAAVIYNRLADDEVLGIDATIRYEVGYDKPLTESQLAADTPYNTRINPGLPPTPIGNPGLDSLKAAADPADVDYKYYVFKPGTCGEHTFTADYDEFLALSDEYQAALEAEGGQPDDC